MLRRTGSFGPFSMPCEWFRVHFRLGMSRTQSVKSVNFTIIGAHSAPDAQGLMRSTVEVRSAAGVQHRRRAAPQNDRKMDSVTQRSFLSRDVPKKVAQTEKFTHK